jgi:hypothetical protein
MKKLLFPALLLLLTACSDTPEEAFDRDNVFPPAKALSDFPLSAFQVTLESPLDLHKNSIYAASLLYCWDEIKRKVGPVSRIQSPELQLMHNSKSYLNVLRPDEYASSICYSEGAIVAKAFFKKVLPFAEPFDNKKLLFDGEKVNGFGFSGPDSKASLVYYQSDSSFAIRLLPLDKSHEIILVMSDFSDNASLKSIIDDLGRHEAAKHSEKDKRKTHIVPEDIVRIPDIQFNLENNYRKIEGTGFHADNDYTITVCYQRTAFLLNRAGAKAESEAEIHMMTAIMPLEEEKSYTPKRMIFNKPYVILLKRKDAVNPYFAMYVANADWMNE